MSVVIPGSAHCRFVSRSLFSEAIFINIQKAHASSANRPVTRRSYPIKGAAATPTNVVQHPNEKSSVNPPVSSLPPLLDRVERRPDQSTVGYYFNIGKSYIRFYKTALKAVWINSREARAIISRISAQKSQRPSSPYLDALQSGLLTRAEFQFITRSRKDIKKLPLVGLLVAVCGEFTPLLVVFVSGIIPRTAWIPKQEHRVRVKTEKRREESFRRGTIESDGELKRISTNNDIEVLNPAQILHVSRALGLHSTLWENLWDRPPQWLARFKVRRALDYLQADDSALQRDGGAQALSDAETERACEERGFDVLKYNIKVLRSQLELYMRFRMEKNISVAAMTLIRPSGWEKLV